MTDKINVAIAGATGLVGSTLLTLLQERKFPIANLYLLASQHSEGVSIQFDQQDIVVTNIDDFDFAQSQLTFFCTNNEVSKKFVPIALSQRNCVIDKSSYYRNDDLIPLVVPEVNFATITKQTPLIANPNCTTIPMAVALKPIYDAVGISRLNIATYQSVSGSGKDAMRELEEQTHQVLNCLPITKTVYADQIAFNVIPKIDEFESNGYTREEMKMVWELQKIFNDNALAINPTAVRVPVFCGHSAAIHMELKQPISIQALCALYADMPSIKLFPPGTYPTPASDASGKDLICIGRIRHDPSKVNSLNMWLSCDNLRKGAALNAVQIAERLFCH
jgi:aspartate-semialdehyde dehydrogenase